MIKNIYFAILNKMYSEFTRISVSTESFKRKQIRKRKMKIESKADKM